MLTHQVGRVCYQGVTPSSWVLKWNHVSSEHHKLEQTNQIENKIHNNWFIFIAFTTGTDIYQ